MFDPGLGEKIKVLWDTSEGRSAISFLFEDAPCPAVFVKNQSGMKAAQYKSIHKDFEFILASLDYYVQNFQVQPSYIQDASDNSLFGFASSFDQRILILRSIYMAAVITYGKAFVTPEGRNLKLMSGDIFQDVRHRQIHSKIMNERHEYIAHAGSTRREATNTVFLLHPDYRSGVIKGPISNSVYLQAPNKDDILDFAEISRIILMHCQRKMQIELDKVFMEYSRHRVDDLYSMATTKGDRMLPQHIESVKKKRR